MNKATFTPRRLLLAYLLLWLFEGAMRKWLLPSLQNPLYFVRVIPVAIAVVFALGRLRRPWPVGAHIAIAYVLFVAVFTAIHVENSDQTVIQAVLGCRLWLEAVLMPLALGPMLKRDDVLFAARLILVLAFPVAALALAQVVSPTTDLVNKLLAADGSDNFTTVGDTVRATGLFTSSLGHVTFILLAGASALALLNSTDAPPLGQRLALAASPIVVVMAVTSGSRSAVFGLGFTVLVGSLIAAPGNLGRIVKSSASTVVAGVLALSVAPRIASEAIAGLSVRFAGDGLITEPRSRVATGLFEWMDLLPEAYPLGQGLGVTVLGLGNQGFGPQAEVELSQWVVQLGPSLMVMAMALRLAAWAYLAWRATIAARYGCSEPAAFLAAGMFIGLNGSVTSQVSANGFTVLSIMMAMGAINTLSPRNSHASIESCSVNPVAHRRFPQAR